MGLICAGMGDCEAVPRGFDYLIRTQNADGTWDEDQFTGTGFPKVFYLRYHLYRHSFPTMALGMWSRIIQHEAANTADSSEPRASI
jgi:squalene-hopene/tetraprenyl-beta-curcumene cyclase